MDVMNVANMAMNMSQTQLMTQVGTAGFINESGFYDRAG